MSAPAIPDPALVLKRLADRLARDAGDEVIPPDVLDQLVDTVRHQIVDPLTAGGLLTSGPGMVAEVERLTAEVERLRAELETERADRGRYAGWLQEARIDLMHARQAQPPAHQHAYPWPNLEGSPRACECGKPWPGGAR